MTESEEKYGDILNLPHHQSKVHQQMSIYDRAAQFSPFAALIYVILPIKKTKASMIAPNNITSFFCIFLGNFCLVYRTPRFFFDIISPLFFYFI